MKKEQYIYKKRVIAFLDVLGTKELVKEEGSPRIFNAMAILSAYKETGGKEFEISAFSDTIVISFASSEDVEENLGNLKYLISDIIFKLCTYLFSEGILIRGSITIGNLYHKNNEIMGAALIDAYEMESRIAFYPRVILGREIEEMVKSHTPLTLNTILEDSNEIGLKKVLLPTRISDDGYYYLDWLYWYVNKLVVEKGKSIKDSMEDFHIDSNFHPNVDLIEKAKKTIEKNLTELEEKHSAFVKWRWVATYFNKLIEEHDLVEYKISI